MAYKLRVNQLYPYLLSLLLLVVNALSPTSVLATPSDPGTLNVHVDSHGLVSVTAADAPLKPIIEAIRPLAKMDIVGDVSAGDRVTANFQSLPLDKAIAKLTDRYIFVHDEAGGPVTRIVLFRQGEAITLPQSEPPARSLNSRALEAWKHGTFSTHWTISRQQSPRIRKIGCRAPIMVGFLS